MKVQDLMSQGVLTCRPDDNLAVAAKSMWDGDCGMLPVLEDGELHGVITDRDICMGVTMQSRRADEIPVYRVMNPKPCTIHPAETLKAALELMGKHRVRRLPVVDDESSVIGTLSINDLILEAKASTNKLGAPSYRSIVDALQKIGEHKEQLVVAS